MDGTGDAFDRTWATYLVDLDQVKPKVRQRAEEIAQTNDRKEITVADAIDAIREFIPGKPSPSVSAVEPPRRWGWFNRNVTGFIGVTATLAIIFGVLGLVPFLKENVSDKYAPVAATFLEIAKIFAGALVGGAAGIAASSPNRR